MAQIVNPSAVIEAALQISTQSARNVAR